MDLGADDLEQTALGQALSQNDAAILEAFVVPRYLDWFNEVLLEMLLVSESARVLHLACRTGEPALRLLDKMPRTMLIGVDASEAALELARGKIAGAGVEPSGERSVEYRCGGSLPIDIADGQFSHAMLIHPLGDREARVSLFREMRRLMYSGGQALIAMPLSSSFPELMDLLREYALKFDDGELSRALEASYSERITIESLSEELEEARLVDIDFEVRKQNIGFDSGRALVEDPVTRFFILPEVQAWLDVELGDDVFDYLVEAVDKYWSDDRLELGVNYVGLSARR